MPRTTRRQALVTIAGGLSAGSLAAQHKYVPRTVSPEEYEMLGALVDMILPASETPGARAAGVHAILDEDLADKEDILTVLRDGMQELRASGFDGMNADERIALLTRFSEGEDPERTFFDTLKGLTIDAYYSTEIGLVEELGYQGNTYLAEFPGCTHQHELEDGN